MRFWLSGPRFLGVRPGVSFGASDFRRLAGGGAPEQARSTPRSPSFVYVIRGEHGRVKVGSSWDPKRRVADLQTGSPFRLTLAYAAAAKSNNAVPIEFAAHQTLARHRCAGEWFDVDVPMAVAAISAASFNLNDPIVAIPLDRLDEVLRLSAQSDGSAFVQKPKRSAAGWFVFFLKWFVATPIIAFFSIILAIALQIIITGKH